MFSVRDLIWICIFFIVILILLMLLRPIFILQRDPITQRPIDEINGTKLFGWTLLFTIIATLIYYLLTKSNCRYESVNGGIIY